MYNKYFKDLNLTDFEKEVIGLKKLNKKDRKNKRYKRFQKQKKKMSFSEMNTWNLDMSLLNSIYGQLMMYKDVANVDLTYHKIECFDGKIRTEEEIINIILKNIIKYRKETDGFFAKTSEESVETRKKIFYYLNDVYPYLWW